MHLERTRVLLVEDDDLLRGSLSAVLNGHGYQVRSAADGFAALADMRIDVPEILISDLNMPSMSGFELLTVVRRRFPAVWVIAMSGAFAGCDVPTGVVADTFYEKGTEILSLISMVGSLAKQQARPALQKRNTLVPVWVHEKLRTASGDLFIIIPCPECLRTFPQPQSATHGPIQRTRCFYCGVSIDYALLQRRPSPPPLALRHPPSLYILSDTEFRELSS